MSNKKEAIIYAAVVFLIVLIIVLASYSTSETKITGMPALDTSTAHNEISEYITEFIIPEKIQEAEEFAGKVNENLNKNKDPVTGRTYTESIDYWGQELGVPPALFKALVAQESMGKNLGCNVAGYCGVAQIHKNTYSKCSGSTDCQIKEGINEFIGKYQWAKNQFEGPDKSSYPKCSQCKKQGDQLYFICSPNPALAGRVGSDPSGVNEYYKSPWVAAIRAYNGWGCGGYPDHHYAEKVLRTYSYFSGIPLSKSFAKQLPIKYYLKPSFKVHIDYDLSGTYGGLVEEAKAKLEDVKSCFEKGGSPNSCSGGLVNSIDENKISEHQKDYIIKCSKSIPFKGKYYQDDITHKFAMIIQDAFAPPAVTLDANYDSKNKQFNLNWNKPSYDAAKYAVGINGVIKFTDKTSYSFKVEEGKTYTFSVKPFDDVGNAGPKITTQPETAG